MRIAVGSEHLGARVTVRRLLSPAPPGGRPVLGDVVGLLRRCDETALEVERADGRRVLVPRADVLAARAVGPARGRP